MEKQNEAAAVEAAEAAKMRADSDGILIVSSKQYLMVVVGSSAVLRQLSPALCTHETQVCLHPKESVAERPCPTSELFILSHPNPEEQRICLLCIAADVAIH